MTDVVKSEVAKAIFKARGWAIGVRVWLHRDGEVRVELRARHVGSEEDWR